MRVPKGIASMLHTKPARAAAAIGGASAVAGGGFVAAYAATNRGDYRNRQKWMTSALLTSAGIGAASIGLAVAGAARSYRSVQGAKSLGVSLQAAALDVAAAGADRVGPAATRLNEQVAAMAHHGDLASRRNVTGIGMVASAGALAAGGFAGMMVTSTRLDPGVLEVNVRHDVYVDKETVVEQGGDTLSDLGGAARSAADTTGGALNTALDVLEFWE